MSHRILVTGSGGIGGVNFITALKSTSEKYLITGTDFNKYYLEFPQVDLNPRHSAACRIERTPDWTGLPSST